MAGGDIGRERPTTHIELSSFSLARVTSTRSEPYERRHSNLSFDA
jgi:hypothetical protein